MLQSISWLQFGIFIFIGLVSYFGYVLYRFYGREVQAFLALWKDGRAGEKVEQVQKVGKEKMEKAGKRGNGEEGGGRQVSQWLRSGRQGPARVAERQGVMSEEAAAEQPKLEMFKVMEKIAGLLPVVINDDEGRRIRPTSCGRRRSFSSRCRFGERYRWIRGRSGRRRPC